MWRGVEGKLERDSALVAYVRERVKSELKPCNWEDDRAFPRKTGSRRNRWQAWFWTLVIVTLPTCRQVKEEPGLRDVRESNGSHCQGSPGSESLERVSQCH